QVVLLLGDVLFELDAELDQARGELSDFLADFGRELVPGATKVSQRELEQTRPLAGEGAGGAGGGELRHRLVQVLPEDEVHRPLLDPCLGDACGVADVFVLVDVPHECPRAEGTLDPVGDLVEGGESRLPRPLRGGDEPVDQLVGLGDRVVGDPVDFFGGGGETHRQSIPVPRGNRNLDVSPASRWGGTRRGRPLGRPSRPEPRESRPRRRRPPCRRGRRDPAAAGLRSGPLANSCTGPVPLPRSGPGRRPIRGGGRRRRSPAGDRAARPGNRSRRSSAPPRPAWSATDRRPGRARDAPAPTQVRRRGNSAAPMRPLPSRRGGRLPPPTGPTRARAAAGTGPRPPGSPRRTGRGWSRWPGRRWRGPRPPLRRRTRPGPSPGTARPPSGECRPLRHRRTVRASPRCDLPGCRRRIPSTPRTAPSRRPLPVGGRRRGDPRVCRRRPWRRLRWGGPEPPSRFPPPRRPPPPTAGGRPRPSPRCGRSPPPPGHPSPRGPDRAGEAG